jgi:multidrug efflux pump subunit AcrB
MDIDKEKALKLGVSLNDLYTTIGAFMGGAYVNDFTVLAACIKHIFRQSRNTG